MKKPENISMLLKESKNPRPEKILNTMYEASITPWLGIEKSNWWSERLYGDSAAGFSMMLPSAVSAAATFNTKLIEVASNSVLSNKRVKYCELNKQITQESIVLLKNDKLLPLSRENIKKIALIGLNVLTGKDCETSSVYKNVLDGLKKVYEKVEIVYPQEGINKKALKVAKEADLVIFVMAFTNNEIKDKTHIPLTNVQQELMEAVCSADKPTILLNFTDICVDLAKANELCDAILQCWNTGQLGGEAAAKMIFGDYQPSGKLPMTLYKDIKKEPHFIGTPLYPFGYGLTYSFVEYYRIYLSKPKIKAGEDITVTIFLKNKGKYETKDVVQVYIVDEEATEKIPCRKLAAFKKVVLSINEEVRVSLTIKEREMALINKEGKRVVEPGRFSLYVGGGQPDDITAKLYNRDCLHIGFLVE